jgi:hypothetical protein
MSNPFIEVDIKALKKVSKELKKASKTHAGQADKITSALPMKSPMRAISASCKAWAKRRYDVWPSAYASGAAVKRQKAGKC